MDEPLDPSDTSSPEPEEGGDRYLADALREPFEEGLEGVIDRAQDALDAAQDWTAEHPVAAVGGAFAFGLVLGLLLGD